MKRKKKKKPELWVDTLVVSTGSKQNGEESSRTWPNRPRRTRLLHCQFPNWSHNCCEQIKKWMRKRIAAKEQSKTQHLVSLLSIRVISQTRIRISCIYDTRNLFCARFTVFHSEKGFDRWEIIHAFYVLFWQVSASQVPVSAEARELTVFARCKKAPAFCSFQASLLGDFKIDVLHLVGLFFFSFFIFIDGP